MSNDKTASSQVLASTINEQEKCIESPCKIFVLMPFGSRGEYQGLSEEAEYIYHEIIHPGVLQAFENSSITPCIIREVDKSQSGSITDSIVRGLVESDIVIVDITGQNSNVFLELGIRYALKSRITVLLTQEPEKIPFDIQGYRFIEYSRFRPSLARKEIANFIQKGISTTTESDSIVFDVFRNMSVIIPGVSESHGSQSIGIKETMRWDDYMSRIEWTINVLGRPITEGRYIPDALVGISNGGLIVADLIGREVFREKPIVALWANRRNRNSGSNYWFFDNPYNIALCDALKNTAKSNHPDQSIRVTLVDDHYGSGTTALQAAEFLRARLGEDTKIVYFPMVSRRVNYLNIVENMLPYAYEDPEGRKVFNVTKDDFIKHLKTDALQFPYLKKDIIGE